MFNTPTIIKEKSSAFFPSSVGVAVNINKGVDINKSTNAIEIPIIN